MNPTETFPHRRARDERYRHYCACGDSVPEEMFKGVGSPLSPSYTWGSDCPAALREALEVERARMSGPHVTPTLMRRIEALGFVAGSGEPVGWLVAHAEELSATLANERGEGDPPVPGWRTLRRAGEARWVLHNERPGRVLDVVRQMSDTPRTIVSHWWDREVDADGTVIVTHSEGEARTMRAAMRAAFEALAARSSTGGAS